MIHIPTRIASLVLAFGFFIGCSTLQSSNSNAPQDLSAKELQQRIDSLDQQIDSGEVTPDLLFQKGKFLTELAQKQSDPGRRATPYTEARKALTEANELYQGSEKVQGLLKVTWSSEHNEGVKILQSDTTGSPDFSRATAHFNNATIVIPDSAVSYQMKARAFYRNQQEQQAINTLEKARENVDDVSTLLLEQLAFLYLENDQPRKAIEIFEQAESFSDQNLNLLHGLSNAYINAGEHKKAVELLDQLIENKPENIVYGQTLAMELYFIASEELDAIASDAEENENIDQAKFSSVDSLLERSENQFERILEENSEDEELRLSFAKFYHNSASKYQQLLPHVDASTKEQIEQKIEQYLSSSIPLLEQLAEQRPEEKEIWQKLFQAYSYLGMEEKARNAKSNF